MKIMLRPSMISLLSLMCVLYNSGNASALTWYRHSVNFNAGWSGAPFLGYPSVDDTWTYDSLSPESVHGIIGMTGMATAVDYNYLINGTLLSPGSGLDMSLAYFYGAPDSEMRDFYYNLDAYLIFKVDNPTTFFNLSAASGGSLGAWDDCLIETGSYSGGIFTPSGVAVDLELFSGYTAIGAGEYRFTGRIHTAWSSNVSFSSGRATTLNWRVYEAVSVSAPEPGTLALLALGIAGGIVARRRK